MRYFILLAVFVLFAEAAFSQTKSSNRKIYMELGGAGLLTSINYERNVWIKNSNSLNIRAGAGYLPTIVNTEFAAGTYCLILGANYMKSVSNHHVVIGFSNSFANTFTTRTSREKGNYIFSNLVIPAIGYQFKKPEKNKFFLGVGYSPVISTTGYSVTNKLIQYKNHLYVSLGITL